MDPNETLKQIDRFLTDRKTGNEVDEWCEYLYDWLHKGGFKPDWSDYGLGTSYYECRKIHIERGDRLK